MVPLVTFYNQVKTDDFIVTLELTDSGLSIYVLIFFTLELKHIFSDAVFFHQVNFFFFSHFENPHIQKQKPKLAPQFSEVY